MDWLDDGTSTTLVSVSVDWLGSVSYTHLHAFISNTETLTKFNITDIPGVKNTLDMIEFFAVK